MSAAPRTLLLTNDDGIDAPGLEALRAAAAGFGRLRLVAPIGPHSGCGHRVTTHEPIAVTPAGDRSSGCRGDPRRLCPACPAPPRPGVLLGPGRDQRGGEPGDRRLPLRDRGGGARGRDPRPAGDCAVAVHCPWPADRLAGGRPPCRGGPRQAPRDRLGAGDVLECQPPSPRAWRPEPGIVFCPLDPSPLPLAYRRRRATAPSTAATIKSGSASHRAMSMSASAARSR